MGRVSRIVERIKERFKPKEEAPPMSVAPPMSIAPPSTGIPAGSVAVGSGKGGGTLIQTPSGKVYEAPISAEPGTTFRGGGGGGGAIQITPTAPSVAPMSVDVRKPQKEVKTATRLTIQQQLENIKRGGIKTALATAGGYAKRAYEAVYPIEQRRKRQEEILAKRGELGETEYVTRQERFPTRGTIGEQRAELVPLTEDVLLRDFSGTQKSTEIFAYQRQKEAEKSLREVADAASELFQQEYDKEFNRAQQRINQGLSTLEDEEKYLNDLKDKYDQGIEEQIEIAANEQDVIVSSKVKEFEKKRASKEFKALLPFKLVGAAATGAALAVAPPIAGLIVGTAATGAGVLAVAKGAEQLRTGEISLRQAGIMAGEFALGTTAAFAGFGAVRALKGKPVAGIPIGKINAAIERAPVESTTYAIGIDGKARQLVARLPPEAQMRLREFQQLGYEIRFTKVKLKPNSIADGKILPKIEGNYVEIRTKAGDMVDSYSLGSVIVKSKDVSYSRDIISQAQSKLGEGRTITQRYNVVLAEKKGLIRTKKVPIESYRTLEDTYNIYSSREPRRMKAQTRTDIFQVGKRERGTIEKPITDKQLTDVLVGKGKREVWLGTENAQSQRSIFNLLIEKAPQIKGRTATKAEYNLDVFNELTFGKTTPKSAVAPKIRARRQAEGTKSFYDLIAGKQKPSRPKGGVSIPEFQRRIQEQNARTQANQITQQIEKLTGLEAAKKTERVSAGTSSGQITKEIAKSIFGEVRTRQRQQQRLAAKPSRAIEELLTPKPRAIMRQRVMNKELISRVVGGTSRSALKMRQLQPQKVTPRNIQMNKILQAITPITPTRPSTTFAGGRGFAGFGLPPIWYNLERGGRQASRPRRAGGFGKPSKDYIRSIGALLLGRKTKVSRKQYAGLRTKQFTGLELRPIVNLR